MLKKLSLIIAIFFLIIPFSFAATYNKYVANAGSGGSDSNDGESGNPWETFTKVNTWADANISTDDILNLYLNKGDSWVSDDTLFEGIDFPNCTIKISAYGSGNDPVIDISTQRFIDLSDSSDVNLTIENFKTIGRSGTYIYPIEFAYSAGDFTVQDFIMDGTGGAGSIGDPQQVIRAFDPRGAIVFQRGTINDMGPAVNPNYSVGDTLGMVVFQDDGSQTPTSLDINNITCYNIDSDCIQLTGVEFTGVGASKGDIHNNTFYNCGENAIDIKSSLNINVYENTLYRNNWAITAGDAGYLIGIWKNTDAGTWSDPDGYDIYNNYLNGNYDGTYDRPMIHVQNMAAGGTIKIRDNRIKNGLQLFISDGAPEIYNNIFWTDRALDHADGEFYVYHAFIVLGSGVDATAKIYHNAFYDHQSNGAIMTAIWTATANFEAKNNLLQTYKTDSFGIYDSGTNDFTADYNRYYNSNDTELIKHNGVEYTTANFSTYTDLAGHTNEENNTIPFSDAANEEFWLTEAGITGEDLGASFDLGWHKDTNRPPLPLTKIGRGDNEETKGVYVFQSAISAIFDQADFRGYLDNNIPGSATAKAAVNGNWEQDVDDNFRVRFAVNAGSTAEANKQLTFEYRKNGGTWADATISSQNVIISNSIWYADEQADGTKRVYQGADTFTGGVLNEDNTAGENNQMDFVGDDVWEVELSMYIISGDVNDEDTIEVRVKDLDSYSNTPTITVNEEALAAPVAIGIGSGGSGASQQ
jgi:hypothetical protein